MPTKKPKMKMWNMYYPVDLIAEVKKLADDINATNPALGLSASDVVRIAIHHGIACVRSTYLRGAV